MVWIAQRRCVVGQEFESAACPIADKGKLPRRLLDDVPAEDGCIEANRLIELVPSRAHAYML